jgi:membrane-associated phospholipid phosphatase
MVAFVATSRMYRGMHHPLDVAGGVVVGIAAVTVVVYACRTAGAVAELRGDRRAVANRAPGGAA